MPKRSCPFEESFEMQHKIHVGTRQVNEGIMRAEKMEHVYNRTLKMLFSGSKQREKNSQDALNNNKSTNVVLKEVPQMVSTVPLRQMEITAEGRLMVPHKDINNENVLPSSRCPSCVSAGSNHLLSPPSCNYCDKSMCESCGRPCSKCEKMFCPPCSFLEYDGDCEKVICLSCF